MNWEYKGQDTAYLKLKEVEDNGIKESVQIPDTGLVLDFDHENRLVGIETFSASHDLPKQILETFSDKDGDES